MALGKAFIEVHADTKPFAKELGAELGKILKAVENGPSKKIGEKLGKEIGDGATKSFNANFKPDFSGASGGSGAPAGGGSGGGGGGGGSGGGSNKGGLGSLFNFDVTSIFGKLGKGVVDTIDDGLSGLPAELKAALGAAVVAVAPFAVALGGGIAGGIITGFTVVLAAGLAAGIGASLPRVQARFETLTKSLLASLQRVAGPFAGTFIDALDLVEDRFVGLESTLQNFVAEGVKAFTPLINGVFNGLGNALTYLNGSLGDIEDFSNILGNGLDAIITKIGEVFATIAADDDAKAALNDVLLLVVELIDFLGRAIKFALDLYGAFRDIVEILDIFSPIEIGEFSLALDKAVLGATGLKKSIEGLPPTVEQAEEALVGLNKQLTDYLTNTQRAFAADIDFERSLDELTASLKENGTTLDITTEKGRQNREALMASALALRETRDAQIALTGDVKGATAAFMANREILIKQAIASGLSKEAIDLLIGAILAVPPPIPTVIGPNLISQLKAAYAAAKALAGAVASIGTVTGAGVGGALGRAIRGYADGGIFNTPTLGVFGEAGEEVIIPTTKPGRAAELISQSPMLSSMMTPTVNVYIGNQQLDAYIDQRVARSQVGTARALAYGSRSI